IGHRALLDDGQPREIVGRAEILRRHLRLLEPTAHAGRVGPRVLEQGREPLGLVALARAGGHGLALAIPVARAPVHRLRRLATKASTTPAMPSRPPRRL